MTVGEFISSAAIFWVTMAVFLGIRDKKHHWAKYLMLFGSAGHLSSALISDKTLAYKLYVTSLMITALFFGLRSLWKSKSQRELPHE